MRTGEFEAESRLEGELAYGLRAPHGLGVVTPYMGVTLAHGGSRTLRTGARWSIAPETTLSLEASHGSGAGVPPSSPTARIGRGSAVSTPRRRRGRTVMLRMPAIAD